MRRRRRTATALPPAAASRITGQNITEHQLHAWTAPSREAWRAPLEFIPAFEAAHREWLLSRDLEATTELLRDQLGDPTADATCETLLIAHQLGGSDLDRRLAALAEDRRQDLLDRKDARSRQAGVRFARRFVLLVPLGMALMELSIGDGREAYQSTLGQLLALGALGVLSACWLWSGRILRLPNETRVFGS